MKKLFIFSFIILLCSFLFLIFIKDTHIRWQHKLFHYISIFGNKLFGVGSTFNRARYFLLSRLIYKDRSTTRGQFINNILIEELTIHSRWHEDPHDDKQFTIKLYIPRQSHSGQKLPVMIYIHGGGFVIDYDDDKSFQLAKEGMFVISVWYRLAPEYKYPAALEDCYSTLLWLNETNNDLIKKYADLNRISLIGDSAGGNLASLVPFVARERKFPHKISHQVLIYPTTITKGFTESSEKYKEEGYVLNKYLMDWFIDQYIPQEQEHLYDSPFVNPAKNTNFTNIPHSFFILATHDPLYSEGKHYAELLKSNGVNVDVEEYESIHGFWSICKTDEESDAFRKIIDYLKRHEFIR
jgi:acetyl esterase